MRVAAPQWISTGGHADRRRMIAATVALEIVHGRPDVSWRLRWPFVAWACELVRKNGTHTSAERWWFLASIAVMEEAGDWSDLVGAPRGGPMLPARRFFDGADQEEFRFGHLAHARAAFPNEPRFRLADVLAAEHATLIGSTSGPPPHGVGAEEASDRLIEDLRRRSEGAKVDSVADLTPDIALRVLRRIRAMPQVVHDLTGLLRYDAIRGEVELHLGFFDIRSQRWPDALTHLARVRGQSKDAFLVGLSDYFSGWALQRSGQRDEAIAAYRRALEALPGSRSVSLLLAGQLALAGRMNEAYETTTGALALHPVAPDAPVAAGSPAVPDAWALFALGDARLLPEYLTRIRELLR